MFELRPLGRFLPISPEGFIINDCDPGLLNPAFREAVVDAYESLVGERLHSLYLRGSLARGTAIPQVSDADTFAVIDGPAMCLASAARHEAEAEILKRFPDLCAVDFATVALSEVLGDRRNPFAFMIQTQSLCLAGEDLTHRLAPYRPDAEIAGEVMYLPERLCRFETHVRPSSDARFVATECSILMKGVVRSGFDLVIARERAYTRDLYLCYDGFVRHYPDWEPQMRQAVHWAVEPTSDAEEMARFIEGLPRWLVSDGIRLLAASARGSGEGA